MSHEFVANYDDVDPISLELISSLRAEDTFQVTNPHTKEVSAYDADAWLSYFAQGERNTTNPTTRLALSPNEVWACFEAVARKGCSDDDARVAICLSHEVKGVIDHNKGCIRLFPASPLFNLSVCHMKSSARDGRTAFHVKYRLVDSRNSARIVVPAVQLEATCPKGYTLAAL
jgi:hypothetical protein